MAKKTRKPAPSKNPVTIIRIEPGLKRALKAKAKADSTTQAALIRTALEKLCGYKASA